MKITNEIKIFLMDRILEMSKAKVNIRLAYKTSVNVCESVDATGCFDGSIPKEFSLALGLKNEYWIPTFIHEYCHYLQSIDVNYKEMDYAEDAWADIDLWLIDLIELPKMKLKKYMKVLRDCELDCEKRTVKVIQENNLPIDIKKYTKQANAYVYFYTAMVDSRQWYTKSPCIVPKILDLMPDTFQKSYNRVPDGYVSLINKYCLKKKKTSGLVKLTVSQ